MVNLSTCVIGVGVSQDLCFYNVPSIQAVGQLQETEGGNYERINYRMGMADNFRHLCRFLVDPKLFRGEGSRKEEAKLLGILFHQHLL